MSTQEEDFQRFCESLPAPKCAPKDCTHPGRRGQSAMKTQCSFCGGLKRHTINCLWHDPDAEFRRDPMSASYASDVRLSNWKIVVILSIGLLSAFGAGVAWTRYVVSCQ